MADDEHLAIIKQGVEVWNKWRNKNPKILPDFSSANLIDANLRGAALRYANLRYVNLRYANLRGAGLVLADLRGANLDKTNLSHATLSYGNLSDANLRGAKLNGTKISSTIFGDNDLSVVEGLDSIVHHGPSTIGTDTLYNSKGRISEAFLRKCGLSDWEIESAKLYNPDLSNEEITNIQYKIHDLRVSRAFQINPLFISYSHSDTDFVDVLEKRLINEGIRFWRDIHHAKAGRLEKQIDQAIHVNDVVLLVLSKHSTNSDWVEHEARKARDKEKKIGKDALCPVALDDSWVTCRWPERLREQIMEYNILDFSNWTDDAYLQKMFGKLLKGLDLFYK
jgi:uncharacterized protein YjbI with pentapeptide repeats